MNDIKPYKNIEVSKYAYGVIQNLMKNYHQTEMEVMNTLAKSVQDTVFTENKEIERLQKELNEAKIKLAQQERATEQLTNTLTDKIIQLAKDYEDATTTSDY